MAISTADGAKTSFALTGPAMEQTEKTRARGPVVILKCANKGCFVTEIWTDAQGYQIRHPRALDEQVASSSRVVALTRVISH
jgi:hypothetical protein